MTDYYAQILGHFQDGTAWSAGWHITSTQTESALSTTWTNAWSAAWTDGTHGMQVVYPTSTILQSTAVATLNSTMHEMSKTRATLALPGTSSDSSLPYLNAVVLSLRSNGVQKSMRGRTFLPAIVEGAVVNDVISSSVATRLRDAARAVQTSIQADGSTIFVFNRKPLKDGTPAFRKTVITTILCSQKPGRHSRRVKKVAASYI